MNAQGLMELAITQATEGVAAGQSPFGCAIQMEGPVIAACHNTVLSTIDITAHAEINALRAACVQQREHHLQGVLVATTCEPCPMCMAALHWARVDTVYFGATVSAAAAGFNELSLAAAELLRVGGSSVRLVGGVLGDKCRQLFQQWGRRQLVIS